MKTVGLTQRRIECAMQNVANCQATYERCKREYEQAKNMPLESSVPIEEIVEFRGEWLVRRLQVDTYEKKMLGVRMNLMNTLQNFYEIELPENVFIEFNSFKISFFTYDNNIVFTVVREEDVYKYELQWISTGDYSICNNLLRWVDRSEAVLRESYL